MTKRNYDHKLLLFTVFLFATIGCAVLLSPSTDRVSTLAHDETTNESTDAPTSTKTYYDESYHKLRGSKQNYGKRFFDSATSAFPLSSFPRWLDAGTGNCDVLRQLLGSGYDAFGTDLSEYSLNQACPDLVKEGKAKAVPLHKLPFPDGYFDVVFSSDVLEHVPEADVRKSVAELVRVSRTGIFFMSISLRLSNYDLGKPEPVSHVTVKPRAWWEEIFAEHGCAREEELITKLQNKMPECISMQMAEKMRNAQPGHEWWREGEKEPWFFIFKCPPASERAR